MKNELKWGSFLSYAQMALSVIISLAYTPVMIRLLGQSEYGLYNTVSSTISMLTILNLGFNAGYIRYYSIYKKDDNQASIQRLNGLMLIIFLVIGIIGLICGLFLSFNLTLVFDKGLTVVEYRTARVLMLLLTINLAISFPMTVFQNIISAHERFIFLKVVGMIKTVCSPLISLPLLLMGYRSVALVLVTVGLSLVADTLYVYYVLFKMRERFVFSGFEKDLLKSIFFYTFFIALNAVIDQINWNIDKLLLGRFKGTIQVAIYSVGYTLYGSYMHFSTAISGVFTPKVHRLVNETKHELDKQRSLLTGLFTKVGRLQFMLLGLIASGLCFFGEYFITRIWAGEGYNDSYWVALLLILPASIALIQNIGIEIQRAENKHKFRSIAYAIMALVNLGLSIYLCKIYGAVGSAVGTAVSLILANGIIMNIYYHKKCNIDILSFWKSILQMARGIILPIALGIFLRSSIHDASVICFVGMIALYTIVYITSMWFLGMNEYEKNLILKPIRKLTRNKKTA